VTIVNRSTEMFDSVLEKQEMMLDESTQAEEIPS
jgi:hypothetical protein